MKIALPINHQNIKKAEVVNKFGQALGFLIYDTKKKEEDFIKNPAYGKDDTVGIGILLGQIMLEKGVGAVLVNLIGKKTIEYLSLNEVEIYKVPGDIRAMEAINNFKKGQLNKYKNEK
jgi:predicted Fe-Mo cluster-binding NifX family protein